VDPLAHKYPALASYTFVANNPLILIDPDGRKIVYSGNLFQQVIMRGALGILRLRSKTFRNIYQDLQRSSHNHTVSLGAEFSNETVGDRDFENGNSTITRMNFRSVPDVDGKKTPLFAAIAYEFGHAWLKDRGLGEPTTERISMITKGGGMNPAWSPEISMDNINQREYEFRKYQESNASKIENMVRGELGYSLREEYHAVDHAFRVYDPINGSSEFKIQYEVLAVLDENYNYKDNDIYKIYNVSPRE